MYRMKNNNTVF